MTTSGSILWVTVPVNADGPSLALSVLAVAFALRYRDDPGLRNAVWMGLAAGGAVSIKALSVPAAGDRRADRALLSHWPRRTGVRDAAVAAGIAVAVYVVAALPFGIAGCGTSRTCTTRTRAARRTHAGAVRKILDTLWDRDKLVLLALGLAVDRLRGALVVAPAPGARPSAGDRALTIVVAGSWCSWIVLVLALLVWEPAMWRVHVAHLVPPLALLAALRPAPWKVLVIARVVAVAVLRVEQPSILWPDGYTGARGRAGAAPRAASRPTRC